MTRQLCFRGLKPTRPTMRTPANGDEIRDAIQGVYDKLSDILGERSPIFILDLVRSGGDSSRRNVMASLTEKEWQILRFTCERAKDSI